MPVEGGPVVTGGRGNPRPSGDALNCPEGSGASLESDARTGEWRMWCTRRVVQEVAVPVPANNEDEPDPLPALQAGQAVPGTRVVAQGVGQPPMSCPSGSAPSVVGNDGFRGVLVWECVKTWQQYVPPVTEGESPGAVDGVGENDLAGLLDDSGIRPTQGSSQQARLSPQQQQTRLAAALGVANGVRSGDVGQAAESAQSLTATYQQVLVSSLPPDEARRVTRDLQNQESNSKGAREVQSRVRELVSADVSKVLSIVDVERPNEVAQALAEPRVQSLLQNDLSSEASRAAKLSMTAGNLPAVAGVLRTEEKVPAKEYLIADALSKGKVVQARKLASSIPTFQSSIVSLALQELLAAQGQTRVSAQVAATRALAEGNFRSGAWYAFQGTPLQSCSTTGCAWLGSASTG